jgi:hypothetical protein
MGGGALTHGRRLLGSKRVSDFMQAMLVVGQGQVFIRQFPITDLAVLDDYLRKQSAGLFRSQAPQR